MSIDLFIHYLLTHTTCSIPEESCCDPSHGKNHRLRNHVRMEETKIYKYISTCKNTCKNTGFWSLFLKDVVDGTDLPEQKPDLNQI